MKNIQYEDANVQTGFNDDEVIRELTAKVAELTDLVDDLRIDLYKSQSRTKQEQVALAKEKAANGVNTATIKNLAKRIEIHEAELLEEANHTKLAKEALEQEQE